MKLTITLRELSPIIQSLNSFVQVPLPAKYSWRLGKVMKKLQSEVDEFSKSRSELFEKYGEEVEATDTKSSQGVPTGKQFRIKEENIEAFSSELEDLLAETLSVTFDPIPLSFFEGSKMTIVDMSNLDMFFEDDEEFFSEEEENVVQEEVFAENTA